MPLSYTSYVEIYLTELIFCIIYEYHLSFVNGPLKDWLYQNLQVIAEDEVGDEETTADCPHQPQQVEGGEAGLSNNGGGSVIREMVCYFDPHPTLAHKTYEIKTYHHHCKGGQGPAPGGGGQQLCQVQPRRHLARVPGSSNI